MISRRSVLGGVAVLAAGGAGVAGGLLRPVRRQQTAAPAWLAAAVSREQALLAGLAGAPPELAATAAPIAADHRRHLAALRSLAGTATLPRSAPSAAPTPPARSRDQLRAAEQAAARQTTDAAAARGGRAAALLASIAACEAGHAELLR